MKLKIFNDLLSILYPDLCPACGNALFKFENCICTTCQYKIPRSNFHKDPYNPVAKVFWGRVPLVEASAYLLFNKEGRVQKLMHAFKYKGRKDIGFELGKMYGLELLKTDWIKDLDFIIAVPLHYSKLKKRGYNQSEEIAKGLSVGLDVPLNNTVLIRKFASETQTRKNRMQRWDNVKDIFEVTDPQTLKNKYVLLVDDVITTGATIEACAQKLLKVEGLKLSVIALAYPV
tara:strand:- start:513 stop:1205 length:693 start_codon:yes stop_codon:yes gene_type:complete